MSRIVVATDLSPRADRALRRAVRIAARLGYGLDIAYAVDHALPKDMAEPLLNEARRRLDRLAHAVTDGTGVAHRLHVDQGDPAEDICALAQNGETALLVIGMHRPRPLADLFRQTTAERLVRHAQHPVLIVRDPVEADYAKVLVAIDFSPGAAAAVKTAEALFPGAEMRGFHAVHIPFQRISGPDGAAADTAFYIGAAESDLAAWAARDGGGLERRTEIRPGGLHEVLRGQLTKHRPDLIALGAHGRSGRAPFLLGSFANDLMRDPPADLLICRA